MSSASSKLLASELDAIRVYPDREYSPKKTDVIVNWGNGNQPIWDSQMVSRNQMINNWRNVCFAIDKDESFRRFTNAGVSIPRITRNRITAIGWLEDGNTLIGRQVLEGTRGQGVILMQKVSQFQNCLLYTKYEEPTKEFRVYIFDNKFLDVLEKRRDTDMLAEGKINYFVRTEENGWVFCRNNVVAPQSVISEAVNAVKALGLVFGGVDIIWNQPNNKASVLEVNTAPGIFGTTVSKLAEAIQSYNGCNN